MVAEHNNQLNEYLSEHSHAARRFPDQKKLQYAFTEHSLLLQRYQLKTFDVLFP